MSQRLFKTRYKNQEVCIVTGWDVERGGFFMFILKDPVPVGNVMHVTEESFLYWNTKDPNLNSGLSDTMEYFERKLAEFGLALPEPIDIELIIDFFLNSNRVVRYWYESDELRFVYMKEELELIHNTRIRRNQV